MTDLNQHFRLMVPYDRGTFGTQWLMIKGKWLMINAKIAVWSSEFKLLKKTDSCLLTSVFIFLTSDLLSSNF